MLWKILDKTKYILYINNDIDLKIRIYELEDNDEVYINYKGFNLTIPMLVWGFGEDLNLASIEKVNIGGDSTFDKYFIIEKNDKDKFLDEIYFFLIDNNMDSVLKERYRASWG